MKMFIVISVFICLNQVYGQCPRRDELHCQMYNTESCPPGYTKRNTYIKYNGINCDACRMCLPQSAQNGCPKILCPYRRIEDQFPQDCAIYKHPQKAWIAGQNCDACATFTKDCSDLSWIG